MGSAQGCDQVSLKCHTVAGCGGLQDICGEADFKLSELITAQGKTLSRALTLKGRGINSTVTLAAEEISNAREVLTFTVAAMGLKNVEKVRGRVVCSVCTRVFGLAGMFQLGLHAPGFVGLFTVSIMMRCPGCLECLSSVRPHPGVASVLPQPQPQLFDSV